MGINKFIKNPLRDWVENHALSLTFATAGFKKGSVSSIRPSMGREILEIGAWSLDNGASKSEIGTWKLEVAVLGPWNILGDRMPDRAPGLVNVAQWIRRSNILIDIYILLLYIIYITL